MTALPKNTINTSLAVFVFLLFYAPGAYAYLDPSTSSMIISALVGIFASIALALKTYWYKLKKLFRRAEQASPSEDPSVDP